MKTLLAATLFVASITSAQAELNRLPIPFPIDREAREISVVVDRGLRRTIDLPRALRADRIALLNKEELSPEQLKALADRRESLAALRYVDVLVEEGLEQNASDIAWYASIAVGAGRVWALPEMVAAMKYLDAETEPKARINQYIRVLYPHAWAGNELALEAVIDHNGVGRLFGPLSDRTRAKIEAQLTDNDSPRGHLVAALSLLQTGELTETQKADALAHLRAAEQSDHLAVAATAANLIEQMAQDSAVLSDARMN